LIGQLGLEQVVFSNGAEFIPSCCNIVQRVVVGVVEFGNGQPLLSNGHIEKKLDSPLVHIFHVFYVGAPGFFIFQRLYLAVPLHFIDAENGLPEPDIQCSG